MFKGNSLIWKKPAVIYTLSGTAYYRSYSPLQDYMIKSDTASTWQLVTNAYSPSNTWGFPLELDGRKLVGFCYINGNVGPVPNYNHCYFGYTDKSGVYHSGQVLNTGEWIECSDLKLEHGNSKGNDRTVTFWMNLLLRYE